MYMSSGLSRRLQFSLVGKQKSATNSVFPFGHVRHAVCTYEMDLVVVMAVETLVAHHTVDVVAPLALPAMASHGGCMLVAGPAVTARVGQVVPLPAAGNQAMILV